MPVLTEHRHAHIRANTLRSLMEFEVMVHTWKLFTELIGICLFKDFYRRIGPAGIEGVQGEKG